MGAGRIISLAKEPPSQRCSELCDEPLVDQQFPGWDFVFAAVAQRPVMPGRIGLPAQQHAREVSPRARGT